MAFPPCATTGVGSLPFTELAEARRWVDAVDLPFSPELLPAGEGLLARVLEGTAATRADFSAARGPFKTQLAGPVTLEAFGGVSAEDAKARVSAVASRVLDELIAKGHEPLMFFDEPALGARGPNAALSAVIELARERGARVGIHCCANANWDDVLALPLDFIGIDVELSLDALAESSRWPAWIARGGALALGVIPTTPGAQLNLRERCDAIEATARARADVQWLSRCLVTTACGLGLQRPERAWAITHELKQAQAWLRAAAAAG